MHALTRTVLSHRRAAVVIWLLLAVAGAATARTTIGRLTTSYALAGSLGYAANQRIAALYGNGGAAAPAVAVITLPTGLTVDSRGVAAEAGRVFAAGHAVPHVRIADYATTGDRAFVTGGARSTFALLFTPGNQPDALQSGWARGVVRWRWAAAAVGLAALAGLILPLFSVHTGLPRATSLAASGPARADLDTLLAGDVPSGVLTPIEVLSTGDTDMLASRLSRLPGIYAAVAPSSPDYQTDGTALITVLPAAEAG